MQKILNTLEALDRHSFERVDEKNSLDTLYNNIFPPITEKLCSSSSSSSSGGSSSKLNNKSNNDSKKEHVSFTRRKARRPNSAAYFQ